MLKKTFLSVISILCCMAISQQSFAISERFPFFSDVSPDHYQFSAITTLLQKGVINGYSDGSFQPDKAVSRAEALKILLKGSRIPTQSPSNNPFADVPKTEWFAKYVYTAKKKHIIKGDGTTNLFNPSRTVNKAEAVKMILEINNESVLKKSTDSEWYDPYFRKAIEKKIIKDGNNANYLLTRGDLAGLMFLYSASPIERIAEKDADKLHAYYRNGELVLDWENGNFQSQNFTIIAEQKNRKNLRETQKNTITLSHDFWKNFSSGEVLITIKGDNTVLIRKKIAVYTRFTPDISQDISEKNISWEYETDINISLSSDVFLENAKGYILTTDESLFEKTIQNNGNNISLHFTPSQKDFYVFELTDNNGLAKAIIPITPKGYYPVLPNNLDTLSDSSEHSIASIIQEINRFRSENGKSRITEKQNLSSLAQVRATDMKERNYFSHYTPEGKTSNDMRSDYSIESMLMENIAMHSEGIMSAVIGLEYSPTHRNILLSDEISFIGIGKSQRENGDNLLVEIFQKTPINQNDLEKSITDIINLIKTTQSSQNADNTLNTIAKKWAETMAEHNEAKSDFGNGNDWKALLDKYYIEGDSAIFVVSHGDLQQLYTYIKEHSDDIEKAFKGKNSYGISLSLSKEGLVYLCLITNKK